MGKIIEFKQNKTDDSMIPVEQWDGSAYQCFFENFCVPNAQKFNISPWDYLANFIKAIYGNQEE